jgi:2-keto-3-deoxy-L-rhamnonate aldolase RhmA
VNTRSNGDRTTKRPLKQRLRDGEVCIGTFLLFLSGGDVVQFFAGLGFDYLILDMEHGSVDLSRARETILCARAVGVAPLVRVAEPNYSQITRALDAGAEGIVLPRVESRYHCRELVRCSRYTPEGERGVTTFGGHTDFAPVPDVPAFVAQRNRDTILIVQLETRAGIENREDILSEPGIDGCLVGTGDLALSFGFAGAVNHPEVLDATERVFETCRQKGLLWTVPIRTPDDAARWQAAGANMLTLATDGGLLGAGVRLFLSSVDRTRRPDVIGQG